MLMKKSNKDIRFIGLFHYAITINHYAITINHYAITLQ